MSESGATTTVQMQQCLQRIAAHDEAARSELMGYASRRLGLLADRMFARFPMLHFREEADDLCQEAIIRLWQSLEEVGPTTVAGFMGLAALQMRRALRDLARRHFGRKTGTPRCDPDSAGIEGTVTNGPASKGPVIDPPGGALPSNPIDDPAQSPDELACWSEFHAAADRLSEPDRTAFDLLYYHELPQAEVATLMNVSVRQVRRYWQSARLELYRMMEGWWPEL
jgi:RNA polymerase sigma factor (sigma-70 family)